MLVACHIEEGIADRIVADCAEVFAVRTEVDKAGRIVELTMPGGEGNLPDIDPEDLLDFDSNVDYFFPGYRALSVWVDLRKRHYSSGLDMADCSSDLGCTLCFLALLCCCCHF